MYKAAQSTILVLSVKILRMTDLRIRVIHKGS